jgi:peptide/nickel transport system substrate-binding protein
MERRLRAIAATGSLLICLFAAQPALAQKSGGILKISFFDNPASMSLHEEATGAALRPMMGVFNNLVMYDQHVAQNSPESIIPDLATNWSWSEDGKELTFPLRQGVNWHDGKPFTAADVKCTWDLLLGIGSEKLRVNPRKTWYLNLDRVTTNGDYEVTFHLKRPQPALLSLLASGWSPVYPCHVPARDMRTHPIGTGPFKFVEFKPNEVVKTARNPDYWKPGRPYLDAIEWHIIPNVATRNLTFIAGTFDISSPYGTSVPLLEEVKSQAPQAICELTATNVSRNLILNPQKPPFDKPDLRQAVALSLDRQAFIDIETQGQGDIGATMLPPPEGLWGMPPDAGDIAGLQSRHRQEPRRSAQDYGEARLRSRPPARGHLVLTQHPRLPQSGGDPDRPAQGDLHRRHARTGRDRQLVPQDLPQGLHDRDQRHRERRRRPRPAIL